MMDTNIFYTQTESKFHKTREYFRASSQSMDCSKIEPRFLIAEFNPRETNSMDFEFYFCSIVHFNYLWLTTA